MVLPLTWDAFLEYFPHDAKAFTFNLLEEWYMNETHEMVGGAINLDQVPDIPPGQPFSSEWQAFKREVARLVNEGQIGKFAVFKGDRLEGVWDTLSLADQAGRR